jgi:hypothetical protein
MTKKKTGSQQWREKERQHSEGRRRRRKTKKKINTNGTHPEEGLKWVENRNGWREKEKERK